MSGKPSDAKTSASPEAQPVPADWRTGLAIAWLVGFSIYFFSQTLPNNSDFTRLDVWKEVPFLYLDLIDPMEPDAPLAGHWSNLPQRFDLILVAATILVGAWGLGHLVLRAIGVPLPARCLERLVFAFGLGLSGLSLLTLACGVAGLLSRPLLLAIIVAAGLGEIVLRRTSVVRPGERPPVSEEPTRFTMDRPWRLLLPLLPFILVIGLGSMTPSVDFDVKEYHFQGPKEFYQNGRISMLPHNVYTSFPFLTEMLTLLGMVIRGDWYWGALAGKAVLMCFQLLSALALFAAGRRWFGPWAGWIAALVYLSTPWTYRISIIALSEGGLSFYLFATLLAAMLALEKIKAGEPTGRFVFLAGLLAGSAMACKYPGVVQVVIPIAVTLKLAPYYFHWARKREQQDDGSDGHVSLGSLHTLAAQIGITFGLGVLVTIGPWLVKNVVETGNPVYPLVYSVFGGADWDADLDAKWRNGHSPPNHAVSDLLLRVDHVTSRNDWLSSLLYGLAPLALLTTTKRRHIRWLWGYVFFLFLAWWALTHRLDRFWVPMTPVVALLAGVGFTWTAHPIWRRTAGTVLALTLVFNLAFMTTSISGFGSYLGDLDEARTQAESSAASIQFLNLIDLPPDATVLFVGEAQVFDARFEHVYNTVFDSSIFEEWCAARNQSVPAGEKTMRDAQEIRRILADAGVTHVYVNWQEVLRYRDPSSYGYTDFVAPQRFLRLQQQGVLGPEIAIPPEVQFGEFAKLGKEAKADIAQWGPELRTQFRDPAGKIIDAWIKGQLFPVLPP